MSFLRRIPSWGYLAALAIFTRFINLGQESLWYDETFTAWLAKLPLDRMMIAIQGDVHPPLWYLIEWVNVHLLGDSEFALRLPSAILGVLCVLLVYRLSILMGLGERAAIASGLIASVLPGPLFYSQDARMYPLLAFFVLWELVSAIKGNYLYFTFASIGAIYSQNLGVFFVIAVGLSIVLSTLRSPRLLIKPMAAGGAILLAWTPWLGVLAQQAQGVKAGFWIQPITLGSVLYSYPNMTIGWRIPPAWETQLFAVIICLGIVSFVACRSWLFERGRLLLFCMIGAPALIVLVSIFWRSVWLPRILLPAVFCQCILWGYMLTHISKPNREVAQVVMITILGIGLMYHYVPAQGGRFPLRDWADTVKSDWQSGDVIYYTTIDACLLFSYYMPGYAYDLMPETTDLNQSLTTQTKEAMQIKQATIADLRDQGYSRVWLVVAYSPMASAQEMDSAEQILSLYPSKVILDTEKGLASTTVYLLTL